MPTEKEVNSLIEKASEAAGNQTKLAEILGIPKSNLTQMKQGKRNANWRIRGKMRAVLGEDPAHAFMAAMAEDLAQSENEDEKKPPKGSKPCWQLFLMSGGGCEIRRQMIKVIKNQQFMNF